jgi:hypothetical protein
VQRAPELYYVWFYNSERVHSYTYEARSEVLNGGRKWAPPTSEPRPTEPVSFTTTMRIKATGWITGPFDKP